jgi:hypothetical protein
MDMVCLRNICVNTLHKGDSIFTNNNNNNNNNNKHQGLGHLVRSIFIVTAALASVSSVSQLLYFLVDCSGMILKGFGVVAFFAGVRASSL